jgi:hypothetical protein
VPSFARPAIYPAGKGSFAVAIGDLNADGRRDVVTANFSAGTVSVLLGRGDGSFRPKRDYLVGKRPYSVAIGDLNGDGRPDLVSTNLVHDTVSVLLNRRDGFQARVDSGTGRDAHDVAIADLNGDGNGDVVTANTSANTVSVLVSRGDGRFDAKVNYRVPRASSVAIADLNADGKRDIAAARYDDGFVSILLNGGGGSFHVQPRFGYRAGPGATSIAIGDLNGDRKPDLVTAKSTYGGDRVSVFPGNGDGTFPRRLDSQPRDPRNKYDWIAVSIGDLSGDSKPDVAVATGNCNECVSVLVNKGNGRFQPPLGYVTGLPDISQDQSRSVAIADVNGDGRADLVAVGLIRNRITSPGGVSVLLANGARPCLVPELRRLTLPVAKRRLARAGCSLGKVISVHARDVPEGIVGFTDPEPPTVLPTGGRVDLYVGAHK